METEQELVPAEAVITPRAVTLTPAMLKRQVERDQDLRTVLNDYIDKNMVKGKDYGSITVKGTQSKPSLLKPGAEKFCSLFKVRATFRKDDETCEMLGNTPGIVAYVCELVDSKGQVIGEGRGVYKVELTDSDFNINKAVKIAEKRAQVDAVLRTGGLSDFFTQDMEDAPKDASNRLANQKTDHASSNPMSGDVTASQLGLIDRLSKQKGVTQERPKTKQEASNMIKKLLELPTQGKPDESVN